MPGMMPVSGNFSTPGQHTPDQTLLKARIILNQVQQGKQGGFVSDMDRIAALRVLIEHGEIDSLVPLLPLLYSHEQAPYNLDHHFQFEPMFRTRMPKQICLMTARQCSKSTSISSSSVSLAAILPNFKQLFITPLFEQVRRLSSNYVRAFIDQSLIKTTLIGKDSDRSVLQRTFSNQSRLQFSFASLTADRARGVNTDRVLYDESFRKDNSYVQTRAGRVLLHTVRPGEEVLSFGDNWDIVWRKVVKNSYHGFRRCYRLKTSTGRYVDLTSESYLATSRGWLRVSQIIEASGRLRAGASAKSQGSCEEGASDSVSTVPSSGDTAGGWARVEDRDISGEPWVTSERVPLDKVHLLVRVRSRSTFENEEEQTRLRVGGLLDCVGSGVQILAGPLLPERQEDCNPRVAGSHRSGGLPSECGLVGSRRREPVEEARFFQLDDQYSGVRSEWSPSTLGLVKRAWVRGRCAHDHAGRLSSLSDLTAARRGLPSTDAGFAALHSPIYDLQAGRESSTLNSGVQVLRADLRGGSRSGVEDPALPESLLFLSGMLEGEKKNLEARPGSQEKTERDAKGEVPFRSGISSQSQRGQPNLSTAEQREGSHLQAGVAGQATREAGFRVLGLSPLRRESTPVEACEAYPHNMRALPSRVGSVASEVPSLPEKAPEPFFTCGSSEGSGEGNAGDGSLHAEYLCSIEDVGEHDVFDIEVEGTHSFVVNGLAGSNCQDIDSAFFPIINESMSHSDWELHSYSGTPKTPENTLSGIWEGSSKGEWFIPCYACGKWNIPSSEHDLDKMIGPWREDISPEKPGLICARCSRPIFSHQGNWTHRSYEERWKRAGYHIAQPTMWIHYTRPEKWAQLLAKRSGYGGFTPTKFSNEVLGEPSGTGAQLISRSEIQRSCTLLWRNNPQKIDDEVLARLPQYQYRVLGIDWGGGGRQTTKGGDPVSLTTLALLGYLNDGTIHCLWGARLFTPFDHIREAQQILKFFSQYKCHYIAHDYTGAGALRETFLKQSGIPQKKILPFAYVRAATSNIINFKPASEFHPRHHYSLDKPRSLLTTIAAIKLMSLRFFQWDFKSREEPGLVEDFLALIEEKASNKIAGDSYIIGKHPQLSDDFAHAVNIGCCSLWHTTGHWPEINDERYQLTEAELQDADTAGENSGWRDGEYQDTTWNPYD